MELVLAQSTCSHKFFNYAEYGDKNCGCIEDPCATCETPDLPYSKTTVYSISGGEESACDLHGSSSFLPHTRVSAPTYIYTSIHLYISTSPDLYIYIYIYKYLHKVSIYVSIHLS
jgi:hypothetical protein